MTLMFWAQGFLRNKSGFSIVEVAIGSAILGGVILASTSVFQSATLGNSQRKVKGARDQVVLSLRKTLSLAVAIRDSSVYPSNSALKSCIESGTPNDCSTYTGSGNGTPFILVEPLRRKMVAGGSTPICYDSAGKPLTTCDSSAVLEVFAYYKALCPPTATLVPSARCDLSESLILTYEIKPIANRILASGGGPGLGTLSETFAMATSEFAVLISPPPTVTPRCTPMQQTLANCSLTTTPDRCGAGETASTAVSFGTCIDTYDPAKCAPVAIPRRTSRVTAAAGNINWAWGSSGHPNTPSTQNPLGTCDVSPNATGQQGVIYWECCQPPQQAPPPPGCTDWCRPNSGGPPSCMGCFDTNPNGAPTSPPTPDWIWGGSCQCTDAADPRYPQGCSASCIAPPPTTPAPTTPSANCLLPWGGTIASGSSVTAYDPSGSCGGCTAPETRSCSNGTLSGSYSSPNTQVTLSGMCGAAPCCGDGMCNGTDNATSCPGDCGAPGFCGDGVCNSTCTPNTNYRTSCDGTAVGTENSASCSADCASTPVPTTPAPTTPAPTTPAPTTPSSPVCDNSNYLTKVCAMGYANPKVALGGSDAFWYDAYDAGRVASSDPLPPLVCTWSTNFGGNAVLGGSNPRSSNGGWDGYTVFTGTSPGTISATLSCPATYLGVPTGFWYSTETLNIEVCPYAVEYSFGTSPERCCPTSATVFCADTNSRIFCGDAQGISGCDAYCTLPCS